MRSFFVRAALSAAVMAPAAGCSLLLQPNEQGLVPPDDVNNTADVIITADAGDTGLPPRDVVRQDIVVQPDTSTVCTTSCNDGVTCTIDSCVAGTCVHTPDNGLCMGTTPTCDRVAGCVSRRCTGPADCSDGNVCTSDTCNPAISTLPTGCVNAPIDGDTDGYPAQMVGGTACGGGTDCNDANAAVHPGALEICNGLDDDCNGQIDNVAAGCPPTNDLCATATPMNFAVPGTMSIAGTTVGASSGVDSACGQAGTGAGDVWYAVTFPANMIVEAVANGSGDPVLIARSSCTAGNDLICDDDITANSRSSRLWIRPERGATGVRTIYFIVDAFARGNESAFTLDLRVYPDPGPAMCGGAMLDVGAGGAVFGRIPARDSTTGSCVPATGTVHDDDFYMLSGTGTGQVTARVTALNAAGTPWVATLYARNVCTSGEVACQTQTGGPAQINFNHTRTGDFLFVDNGPPGALYQLTVIPP